MSFDEVFSRSHNAVLQFSGGKDSLACLYLLKPHWPRLTVMWVNTGDTFPETIAQMEQIADLVPNFMIVHSDQPKQIAALGAPVDLLPFWDSPLGHSIDSSRTRRFQTPFTCCYNNLWEPALRAAYGMGCTLIIRGQRSGEPKKGILRSGNIIGGIEYLYPIQDWTERQVLDYLDGLGVQLPVTYQYFNSSPDCMTCTGYLAENIGKVKYLRLHHPKEYQTVIHRLANLSDAIAEECDILSLATEEK